MLVELVNLILFFEIGPVLARNTEFFKKKSVESTNINASPRLKNRLLIRIPNPLLRATRSQ